MRRFTGDWLRAREAVDHAARSRPLAEAFAAAVGERPRVTDLGAGTGSNLRYLAPLLGPEQRWTLLDNDPDLLGAIADRSEAWARRQGLQIAHHPAGMLLSGHGRRIAVAAVQRDIRVAESCFEPAPTGLTASALLDLTSAEWLEDIADHVVERGLPVLFALTFDGRLGFTPPLDEDALVRSLFLRHQQRDKGFGPALGADAVGHLVQSLEKRGRRVETSGGDWRLGGRADPLCPMFLDGLRAFIDDLGAADRLASWLGARERAQREGELEVHVGHRDLLCRV